jgi:hypothetical protein
VSSDFLNQMGRVDTNILRGGARKPISAKKPRMPEDTDPACNSTSGGLLADAEVAEDYVEEIFDIHGTGDAAEAAHSQAEIFGAEFG